MSNDYQWQVLEQKRKPVKNLNEWESTFGPRIIERENGRAVKVRFQVLQDNAGIEIFVTGSFNNWEKDITKLEEFKLIPDGYALYSYCEVTAKHKDEYKFLIREGKRVYEVHDPAAVYFTDSGNCVVWDFEDPSSYKQKFDKINTFDRTTKIIQTDLPGLIVHFADKQGRLGHQVPQKEYFKFIAESGVIDEIKRLGFNTVQFLPFAQSIDGDNWKFRYLVPFQFAVQKNWGTPDDFAYMIDMLHKAGIAVIGDFVLGHLPYRDYAVFGKSSDEAGLQMWKKWDGRLLYLQDKTPWGTMRLDYDNPHIRNFFISSCVHYLKRYGIDGYRIDNVDGILRFGDNGDGDERPNGRTFLRELNSTLYAYHPQALIHFESHFYYGDNSKMLVAPLDSDARALGATAYNSSRLTYYFHTEYMFKPIEQVTVWKFKYIADEQDWGKSSATVADFHNHDAAAGLMAMRCTGAYAYDAMMNGKYHTHIHAVGKIKTMEAIISFGCEGRTLDLLQTFLLQMGTFEHDTSVQWFLTFNEVNRNTVAYKQKVNQILDDPAFWPQYTCNRKYLNVDDSNKIIVFERSAMHNGKQSRYVIVINTSSWQHWNYKVGVTTKKNYKVVLNSDSFAYSGFGLINYPETLTNNESHNFELLNREVELSVLAPYAVVVLKEED